MEFAWRIRAGAPVPTVEVAGELDVDSGPYLHEQLRSIMRAYGAHLALDLTGVTFIDCSGVNALLASGRDARSLGGWMRVTAASPRVRRIVGIIGLDRVLGVMPSAPLNQGDREPIASGGGGPGADRCRGLAGRLVMQGAVPLAPVDRHRSDAVTPTSPAAGAALLPPHIRRCQRG